MFVLPTFSLGVIGSPTSVFDDSLSFPTIQVFDTEAEFITQTNAPQYTIVQAKDTDKIYVWNGSGWIGYNPEPFNRFSLSLDGTNDYVDIGTVSDLNGSISSVTISAWFNLSAFGDAVISGGSSGSDRFYMQIFDSTTIRYGSGVGFDSFIVPTLSTGTWYHVALVHNGTSAQLYLNNTESSSGAQVVESPTANYGSSFKIGSYFTGSNYFQGLLDEVSVFDSALSTSNLTSIYNSVNNISSFNPVGWWRMGDYDGGTGTTVTDQGSGGNDGTLTNGATFSTSVP